MAEREPRNKRLLRLALAILSGAMLGFSFPPFELGILACFGLVPLLVALRGVAHVKQALWYVYVAMFVFHAITVNWTGGFVHANDPYMMIAGSVTILVHPLFYFLPMGVYLLIRKHFGENLAVWILPVLWVGYEYSHSLSEWSFPWLTLGNSQTYDLARIQFIEYTGVWGLSLWILLINALAYLLCLRLGPGIGGLRSRSSQLLFVSLVVIYVAPLVHGLIVLSQAGPSGIPAQSGASGVSDQIRSSPASGQANVPTISEQPRSLPASGQASAPAVSEQPRSLPASGQVSAPAVSDQPRSSPASGQASAPAKSRGAEQASPPPGSGHAGPSTVFQEQHLSLAPVTLRPLRSRTVTIGIIQSNVDPWDKWKSNGLETYTLYMNLTQALLDSTAAPRPDIVLWPETAFPFDVLGSQNSEVLASLQDRLKTWRIGLLTGLPHKIVYEDSAAAPHSARRDKRTGQRYDWYNAATYIEPGIASPQWYGKMKMVPFAERIPYANLFSFVDFLRWDVGIGGWQIGPDTTVFHDTRTDTRFSTIICYESTYPGFVAGFVRKGAEFISLITIDSWWGKMSGAFQHQQIALLRAVENRRWIARCAVGGISCFIDPYGRAHDATALFTQRILSGTIEKRNALTWYTAHGDLLGEAAAWLAAAFAAAALGQAFLKRKRKLAWQT